MSVEEHKKKMVEEATIFVVDGEPVLEEVIVESIQAHSVLEAKQVELEELERLQSAVENGVEVISTDVATRQVELEVTLVLEGLKPLVKEALEEALVQSIIEAFLHESEDWVTEIDYGVRPIRFKPMSNTDER